MNIHAAFPSTYLKAADLGPGGIVHVLIDRVVLEDVGDDHDKPVIYFRDKRKGLILNRVNANTLKGLFGPETDVWGGRGVMLYVTETEFRGKMVPCIRMKAEATPVVKTGQGEYTQTYPKQHEITTVGTIPEEDIPF